MSNLYLKHNLMKYHGKRIENIEMSELKKLLIELNNYITVRDNHLLLYNSFFWRKHFRLYYVYKKLCKEKMFNVRISLLLWLIYVPLLIMIWLSIFILLDLTNFFKDFTKETELLFLFIITAILFYIFHFLSSRCLLKYKEKIKIIAKIVYANPRWSRRMEKYKFPASRRILQIRGNKKKKLSWNLKSK